MVERANKVVMAARKCAHCRAPLDPLAREDTRYCKPACRVAAFRERQKSAADARRVVQLEEVLLDKVLAVLCDRAHIVGPEAVVTAKLILEAVGLSTAAHGTRSDG